MADSRGPRRVIRFGVFEADLRTGRLQRNGLRVPLPDQPFQVLAILLNQAGELVTREELRRQIWPADTFVDFDHGLNTAITKIRNALRDDADHPQFIETFPRRGYRFIGPVDEPAPKAAAPDTSNALLNKPKPGHRRLTLAIAAIVMLSTTAVWRLSRKPADSPSTPMEVVPLVALQGKQHSPALSPDGNQVAFAQYEGPQNGGIYTTLIGGEKPLRLTNNPLDCCPTWSPDSRRIAFVRYSESLQEMGFYVVPALGGTEHRLYRADANVRSSCGRLDWSPDGTTLAFSEPSEKGLRSRIVLLSLSDSITRQVTSPPDQEYDCEPAFSPDGSSVAFARGSIGGNRRDLFVLPVSGGDPRRLTSGNSGYSPIWTQDGRDIVFCSELGGLRSLWRISISGGTPRPVIGLGAGALNPSASRTGNQLVYQQLVESDAIWRVKLRDDKHSSSPPTRLISSRGFNFRPSFSPDGKRIAFESDRLGYSDIWRCDSDGSNCVQLTSLHGTAGTARWSPDGNYIAFEFQSQGNYQVYVVEVSGGQPRLLPTFPGADNGAPTWSRDGQWIYFYSDHEKGPVQLWKVPSKGGSPARVTRNGGVHAAESDDGRFLYYSKLELPGIWKMSINGGEETRILDQPPGYGWHNWALSPDGIYFLNMSGVQNPRIEFFDFATRASTAITQLEKAAPNRRGIAVSPDGRELLYVQNESLDSYIMVVKGFR